MSGKTSAVSHPYPAGVRVFETLEQGSEEWLYHRAGIVTASVVGQLITKASPDALEIGCPRCQRPGGSPCVSISRKVPTPLKTLHSERVTAAGNRPPVFTVADNDTSRALILNLAAERITGFVERVFPSRSMERGSLDEPYAREIYAERYAPVHEIGFMYRQYDGYRIGFSPDGLIEDDGLLEIKSRTQRIQLSTFLSDQVPAENMAQIQTGLLVSGRDWCDYLSYSSGMPPYVKRVQPDPAWFDAIHAAAQHAENKITNIIDTYTAATNGNPPTARIDHFAELEFTF